MTDALPILLAFGAVNGGLIAVAALLKARRAAQARPRAAALPDEHLELGNDILAMTRALDRVAEWVGRADWPARAQLEISLLAEEMLALVMRQGRPQDRPHRLELGLEFRAGAVRIRLTDDGRPLAPGALAPQAAPRTAEEIDPDALELRILQGMADELTYDSRDGRNTLTATRRVDRPPADPAP